MMTQEQAIEVRNSAVWKNVCKEIDYRISCKLNELVKCKQEELANLQGDIQRLEELKRLPDDVVDREIIPS